MINHMMCTHIRQKPSHVYQRCTVAALNGNLRELRLARNDGCQWDRTTCAAAALNGHLEVLQWARANGCPWNADTCIAAALNGHIAVLQWAKDNGCRSEEHT